ncbi:protein-glutamate methylesterase/protein-glutamine glutaminase [Cucumibacter marinus]|uniref:protein-glutamate methylesterase/protein-glutamine glutaminase n=1 Tax=Cucumibacter marinus TaxID=1121252 RepID=UPI0004016723|nr:chemotaxis response regulator protein-glutamate methylesterase [Cucumibacter marinus]
MTIRVLIVDDSALIREVMSKIIGAEPDMEVIGTAHDPLDAREKIRVTNPDVVTLDVEMPNMNGLAFLEKLMRLKPTPVVMVSTITTKGAEATLLALELGAVDFVAKPGHDLSGGLDAFAGEVRRKVRAAAQSRVHSHPRVQAKPKTPVLSGRDAPKGSLIALGASTGGVDAIKSVLCTLPSDCPPIVIAQHMPKGFTERFAHRLSEVTPLKVIEAVDRMPLEDGHAYIAPGDWHLRIEKSSGFLKCRLGSDTVVSGHRPSVDVLFDSVAKYVGDHAVGAILTGMGKDGAVGLKAMRDAGAYTIGQAEGSALIYGMPKAAFDIGAVTEELPVEEIGPRLLSQLIKRRRAA